MRSYVHKKMRHNSFWLLLFILYNPLLGVISFILTILFSFYMEYGGYIQERADETNRIQEEMIILPSSTMSGRMDGGIQRGLSERTSALKAGLLQLQMFIDALTSRRSYKEAWSEDDAYQEILKCRGTQFDAQVVDAFESAHGEIIEVLEKYKDF